MKFYELALDIAVPILFDSSTVEHTKSGSSNAPAGTAANSSSGVGANNYSPPVFRGTAVELPYRAG